MMKAFSLFFMMSLCIFSFPSYAQKAVKTKSAKEQVLEVLVTRGETKTSFQIDSKPKESSLKMLSSAGPNSGRTLNSEDADYFFEKYKSLPTVKIIPKECQRSFVQILHKSKGKVETKKVSCIGVKTITEPAYADYLRLLVAML